MAGCWFIVISFRWHGAPFHRPARRPKSAPGTPAPRRTRNRGLLPSCRAPGAPSARFAAPAVRWVGVSCVRVQVGALLSPGGDGSPPPPHCNSERRGWRSVSPAPSIRIKGSRIRCFLANNAGLSGAAASKPVCAGSQRGWGTRVLEAGLAYRRQSGCVSR